MIDVKALFLGPKAENQELYESLILEIVRDSCFLRKNFHPQDDTIILEKDKLKDEYSDTVAKLKQHLQGVLAELKKGVPLYHPRYIGHMHGDILLSGIAAYFGTMLYNPNNVVGESSPATTKMELEYINALSKMVGFRSCDKLTGTYAWGHLCSGGTTANIEALWVARNMKYYPLSVKLTSQQSGYEFLGEIFIDSLGKEINSCSYNELFNIQTIEILNIKDKAYKLCEYQKIEGEALKTQIEKFSVTNMGVYGIHHSIEMLSSNSESIELPRVYISKSYHYSWEKALDIIGIGRNQLIKIDVDNGFRMNMEHLKDKMQELSSPTLAVVGILGSSKQGSIDAIDEIVELRIQKEKEKHSFVIHVDGAYGGFLPSIFRSDYKSEAFLPNIDIINNLKGKYGIFRLNGKSTINDKWCEKIKAISKSDSITIDPHKMGYIPYPAGSVIFADTRMKDFISYHPTYLNSSADISDLHTAFLGQWTLEGSRPGAAASACYLSNKVLPFDQDGHGQLIKNTMLAADLFWNTIETFNGDVEINQGFKIVPLYTPETNIISYVVSFPYVIKKSCFLNKLNFLLYEHFSIKGDTIIPGQNFIVAKESFDYCDINSKSFLRNCGIDSKQEENQIEIIMLSSVFMNPLSVYLDSGFFMNFWNEVVKTGQNIIADIMLDILLKKNNGERFNVLWVEDDNEVNSLRKQILQDYTVGKCLDIIFINNAEDAKSEITLNKWDIYILDLNLRTKHDINSRVFNQSDEDAINLSIDLIKSIPDKGNILIYSSYLHRTEIKEDYIIPLLKPLFKKKTRLKDQLVSKTEDYSYDKRKIINGIFSVVQNG